MGPREPYWNTNTSFSPAPPGWDFRFQPEAMSFGSHDGIQVYGSSASSNSRGSRGWVRENNLSTHQVLVPDGLGQYFSSPDISPAQQWTPPEVQDINIDDYGISRRDVVLRPLSFSPTVEGTSAAKDSRVSTSSRSDSSSDYESTVKPHFSNRNFASRRCFMSKAIHPLSFSSKTPTREIPAEFDASTQSASGSIDLSEIPESFEYDLFSRSPVDNLRCGLCERLLSQRSPWSSRRIVKSGDMPTSGVLSCRHIFHAECLDQTTPKAHKSDPPCPICMKIEDENSPDRRIFSKFRSSFPRLKPLCEDGPSKPWGCSQAGDCVEGAMQTPSRNTLMSLNKSRFRKNLSLNRNSDQKFPGRLKKNGSQIVIGS